MIVALVLAAVAAPMVGAAGAVAPGVTKVDDAEGVPVPIALIAATVKVYPVPLVSPVKVCVVTLPTVTGDPTDGVMR